MRTYTDIPDSSFVSPSHQVELSIEHTGSTYIGEHYPIEISVKNADEKPLHVSLDVLIQPSLDDSRKQSFNLPIGVAHILN